jgi:amino acid transporter
MDALSFAVIVACLTVIAKRHHEDRRAVGAIFALSLSMPLWLTMIDQAWTDMVTMASLALWSLLHLSGRKWSASVALGIGLCAKPVLLLNLMPFVIWLPRARAAVALAAVVAAAIAAPMALAVGIGNYWNDTIGIQLQIPVRLDSLSVDAFLISHGWLPLPTMAIAVVVAGLCFLVASRKPRGARDLYLASALLTIGAYLVAKQAFFNYYFDAAICILLAIAVGESSFREPVITPRLVKAALRPKP